MALFSVCTHSGRWSMVDQLREVEAAATCGVKVVRDSIEWGGIQPERGVWNFEKMDFLVNAYEDELSAKACKTFREKVFRTTSGTAMLNAVYGLD